MFQQIWRRSFARNDRNVDSMPFENNSLKRYTIVTRFLQAQKRFSVDFIRATRTTTHDTYPAPSKMSKKLSKPKNYVQQI